MDRDPTVYVIMSLNTHMEVDYSTVHIFDRYGQICGTRVRHENAARVPYHELSDALEWGSNALNEYYQNGEVRSAG